VFACDKDDTATLHHWVRTGELDAFAFCAVSPGDPRTRLLAYLGHRGDAHWTVERREGVKSALVTHGVRLPAKAKLIGSLETSGRRVDALLTAPKPPTAVITDSDSMALLAMSRARGLGLTIGTDVAVTGFQSGLFDGALDTPLTAIRIPVEDAARRVVERLVLELEAGPTSVPGVL
jgi:DNA-binding LacI/PurR family transcriptional regulator